MSCMEDSGKLNLPPSGETIKKSLPECGSSVTGSFPLLVPLIHVPAAEGFPEGMQSGQLLQASAAAVG